MSIMYKFKISKTSVTKKKNKKIQNLPKKTTKITNILTKLKIFQAIIAKKNKKNLNKTKNLKK